MIHSVYWKILSLTVFRYNNYEFGAFCLCDKWFQSFPPTDLPVNSVSYRNTFLGNPFLCDKWLHSSTPFSGNYLPTLFSRVKNSEKTILRIPWKTKFGNSLNSHHNTFIFESTILHTTVDGRCSDGLSDKFLCSLSQSSSADIQR